MADGGKVIIKIDGDNKGFKSEMSGAGKIAKTAAKGIAVGVGAAATAIGAIGTQAVKSYADYEQLVGGVETLFKNSANVVQNYANQAYQTAGMSANQYMETVTGFSASLLQSLGGDTAKAAEYGNQAVIDMSDNANKMGTSIEMIQNAYQGFAKQNYTMLDNLKLGYGGTKSEMERLLADASKISGIKYDISSFADITQAIHVVQTEMGITGTTAEEASTTIQGSLGMVKASWENLLTGLADPNADIDLLMDNVINSVMTFGKNLEPVIEAVLEKIPIMIDTLGERIIQKLPEVVNTILPSLVNTAAQLITTLSDTLNNNAALLSDTALNILMTLVDALISNLPILLNAAITLTMALAQGLADSLPELTNAALDMIFQLVDTLLNNIDMMVDTAISLIMGLADGLIQALPQLIEKVPEIIQKLVDAIIKNAPKLAEAAGQLIGKLVFGIITNLPGLIKAAFKIVVALVKYLKWYITDYLPTVGINIVKGIWNGIKDSAKWLWNKLKGWCNNIVDKIKGFFKIKSPSRVMRDEVGKYISLGVAEGITENSDEVVDSFQKMLDKLEYQRKFDIINEDEYYTELEKLRDKYFKAGSKEWLGYTEKIYSYQKQQLEDEKKLYEDAYKEIADYAEKKLDAIIDKQEEYSKKLKAYGGIFKTVTIELDDGDIEYYALADLKKDTEKLREYTAAMSEARESILKSGISETAANSFFDEINSLSVDEGIKALEALKRVSEGELFEYLKAYDEKLKLADSASAELYKDDMQNAVDESYEHMKEKLTEAGFEVPEEFFEIGSSAASKFGEAFSKQLSAEFEKIKEKLAEFKAKLEIAVNVRSEGKSGGSTYYTDSRTTNIYAGGSSARSVIEEQKQNEIYQSHTSKWGVVT